MKWAIFAALALVGLALTWSLLPVREWLAVTIEEIDSLGSLGIVVYFLLYYSLASATFPSTPLNIGAGLIFDYVTGFCVAWSAGALASLSTFLFSRYFAKQWAQRNLETFPQCAKVVEAMEGQGFRMILLARLNPFIPASIKNFGFGVTEVPFWKYAVGTLLGQLPIVMAYVYLGWAGSATLLGNEQPSLMHYVMIVAGVAMSVIMLVMVSWYGNKSIS